MNYGFIIIFCPILVKTLPVDMYNFPGVSSLIIRFLIKATKSLELSWILEVNSKVKSAGSFNWALIELGVKSVFVKL